MAINDPLRPLYRPATWRHWTLRWNNLDLAGRKLKILLYLETRQLDIGKAGHGIVTLDQHDGEGHQELLAAQTWTGAGQFITNPNANPRGLVMNGLHLSDHCPVLAELQIAPVPPDRDAVNPANIVATKRIRRKSTKTDIDKY
jgi:hypothetical protein